MNDNLRARGREITEDARDAAKSAGAHPAIQKGARLGFVVSGLLHILVGWIALRVAWGAGGGDEADQSGALAMLADTPAGPALLWVAVVGFVVLGLWHLIEAFAARRFEKVHERIAAVGKAGVYAALAFSAFQVTQRAGSSGEESAQSFTAELMSTPGGRFLVGAVGLGMLGGGAFHIWRGATKGFEKDLERNPGRFITEAGRIGYIAKGIAFAVIGMLFISAALSEQASEAGGLDGALKTVQEQPFGPYLLTVVALGIAAFGVYLFGRARYAKL
ncbi:MAG: DUF1206 domain-containing protein [Actinomycetia bacterium]|nr:DUF1206 domain-containing protein [Actinomycetes bacterium]